MTPEAKVVQRIKALVKSYGGEVRKVEWSGRRGAPDLLVLMPGRHFFLEVKAPGEKPRPEQLREFDRLCEAGFEVFVSDGNLEPIEDELKLSCIRHQLESELCGGV